MASRASVASSVSAGGRWRQLGDLPWASARMRCFIVGGRDLVKDQGEIAGVVTCAVALVLVASDRGVAAAAVAVIVMSPSVVHSARKAVTKAFHNFMTLIWVMAPHFQGWAICVLSS